MNVLQRGISLILCVLFLVCSMLFVFKESEESRNEQEKGIIVQRFLAQTDLFLECTYEMYVDYFNQLQLCDVYELKIREYVLEEDIMGEKYRYLISWDEIKEELVLNGSYSFSENAILEMEICAGRGNTEQKDRYYVLIKGGK